MNARPPPATAVRTGRTPSSAPARQPSVVVIFALVSHRQHGDGLAVFDLEQRHVAGAAERNQQLAQERIGLIRLAAGEGRLPQQVGATQDCRQCGAAYKRLRSSRAAGA